MPTYEEEPMDTAKRWASLQRYVRLCNEAAEMNPDDPHLQAMALKAKNYLASFATECIAVEPQNQTALTRSAMTNDLELIGLQLKTHFGEGPQLAQSRREAMDVLWSQLMKVPPNERAFKYGNDNIGEMKTASETLNGIRDAALGAGTGSQRHDTRRFDYSDVQTLLMNMQSARDLAGFPDPDDRASALREINEVKELVDTGKLFYTISVLQDNIRNGASTSQLNAFNRVDRNSAPNFEIGLNREAGLDPRGQSVPPERVGGSSRAELTHPTSPRSTLLSPEPEPRTASDSPLSNLPSTPATPPHYRLGGAHAPETAAISDRQHDRQPNQEELAAMAKAGPSRKRGRSAGEESRDVLEGGPASGTRSKRARLNDRQPSGSHDIGL